MKVRIFKLFLVFIAVFALRGAWGQLTANFVTNPQFNSSNSTLDICAGSTVLFSFVSTGSGINSSTNVSWQFTGTGTPSITSDSRLTPFPVTFPSGTYTATLTLSAPGQTTSTKQITINATSIPPSSPSLVLNSVNSAPGWSTTTIDGTTTFTICPNPNTTNKYIYWDLANVSCSNVSSMTITDPLSNTPPDCNNGFLDNTYNPNTSRFYYLVFKTNFTSGCQFSRVYFVQLGTPKLSTSISSATACNPGIYSLAFTNQHPGVTYSIDWDYTNNFDNDYTATYPNVPLEPKLVSNQYAFKPCTNGVAPPYNIEIRATNSCGTSTQSPSSIYVSQAPDASFTASPSALTICQGTTIIYTDNSTPGVDVSDQGICSSNYQRWWTHTPAAFGGTTTNTSNVNNLGNPNVPTQGPSSFNVTYNQTGTYTIRLIVKNSGCGNDTMTRILQVVPAPIIPAQTKTICTGSTFNATPVNNPPTTQVPTGTTYSWTVTDNTNVTGDVSGSGSSITGTLNLNSGVNTVQNVTYNVTASSGTNPTCSTTFQLIVTVYPQININDYAVTICSGDQFTITPTNGTPTGTMVPPGTTYSWPIPTVTGGITGGASGSNASNVSGTLTNPTFSSQTATYTVTASAGASCPTDQFQVTVTVNNVNAGIIGSNQTKCSGDNPDPFSFSTTPTGAGTISYQWQSSSSSAGPWSDISVATSNTYDPGTTITATTYYQVKITSTLNGVGCTNYTNWVVITVNPKPTITGLSALCAGQSTTLTGSQSPSSVTPWSSSSSVATISNTGVVSTSNTNSGVTTITYINNFNCSTTFSLTVNPVPVISNISTSVCSGTSFSVTPNSTAPNIIPTGTTYSWSSPTGTGFSGGNSGSGTQISGLLTNSDQRLLQRRTM